MRVSIPFTCPRCTATVRRPGLWSDHWSCTEHGPVTPLHPPAPASPELLTRLGAASRVPLWVPWPLPVGWLLTGVRYAGDDHTGPVATVLSVSGPHPLGLVPRSGDDVEVVQPCADLLVVAEQPGVGLGARFAGLSDVDPGETAATGAAHLKLSAAGHDVPLWNVPAVEMAAYVGEAAGVWLWVLVWPVATGAVVLEDFALRDLCDPTNHLDMPVGALSPRLG